jgi:hypothetical protein
MERYRAFTTLCLFTPCRNEAPALLGPWLIAQFLLSTLEQFIQFVDELLKSDRVFLFFDQSAQLVHAFTFLRFHHAGSDEDEFI